MDSNESKKIKKNKKRQRKIVALLMLTGLTSLVLIMGTYAWFIGLSSVTVNNFEVEVTAAESLSLSLNGKDWTKTLQITEDGVLKTGSSAGADNANTAYTGHTNHWVGANGLIPISSSGQVDAEAGRLILYNKSSITATGGGYRLMTSRVNNNLTTEQDGYVVFDLFIRNGSGVDYIAEYNQLDDEAVYLTTSSEIKATPAGSTTEDYGLANSVRVAFVQIGRVPSANSTQSDVTSIGCGATATNTKLCSVVSPTIWEPNNNAHNEKLVSFFNGVCKQKTVTTDSSSGSPVDVVTYSDTPCTPLTTTSQVNTFVVNSNILSSDHVDVYDGLNNYTLPAGYKLEQSITYTDTMKKVPGNQRSPFMYLAANSITKVRIYIYLEGQDVDNYDLISNGEKISVSFGFTKDQLDQLAS